MVGSCAWGRSSGPAGATTSHSFGRSFYNDNGAEIEQAHTTPEMQVEFGVDYIYGWEISAGYELYGSTGFMTQALGDFGLVPEEPASDHFIAWTQSVALGAELTERTTVCSEF